jgi:hypothetical protein
VFLAVYYWYAANAAESCAANAPGTAIAQYFFNDDACSKVLLVQLSLLPNHQQQQQHVGLVPIYMHHAQRPSETGRKYSCPFVT